ncbi:hypothetical protein N8J89_38200 [Crossiella sp. CA-258035]|uniref:MAB_1171c family putative transporter n=1 Tax=Crossiella sp. CA-258035 TaxID=2981138 RepID=UPI0024BD229C|nr:MAB_1171c family putative transporter [Crossiella sp. CA-258035]WHT18874.1 hypothetical protein N8J89_38200 [Crossiella sp. CA-258035]
MTVLQGVLLYVALIWKLYQFSRAPHDRSLRIVTVCLVAAGFAYPLGLLAGSTAEPTIQVVFYSWAQYSLLMTVIYTLVLFFLFTALPPARARVRAWWQAVPLVVCLIGLAAVTFAAPADPGPGGYPIATVAGFYLFADAYLAYGVAVALRWTRRYARGATGRLRTGLLITSIGEVLLIMAAGGTCVTVALMWAGVPMPDWTRTLSTLILFPGILLFIIGVSYPGMLMRLAALRVWWQHLRVYHQLRPLWTTLHRAFPQDSLTRGPVRPVWDVLSLRGVHRRYYRRVIECRDGLVRISPYLAHVRAEQEALSLAEALRAGLRAHAEGTEVAPQAMSLALPEGDGLDDDVRELLALSTELRRAPALA